MNFDVVDVGNVCLMLVKFNSKGNIKVLFMFRIKKIFFIVFIIGDELNNRLFIVMGRGGVLFVLILIKRIIVIKFLVKVVVLK